MSLLFKVLLVLFVTGLIAGCKVAVMVVEGGEVQSTGSGTCAEGTICIVEVNNTSFSETFTAVPNPGQHFVKWNSGEGFLCGGSTDPRCIVSTEGSAGIEAIIASDQTFYIMPIFGLGPDTVTVDGREWAQVDQFTNLSWDDINAVCPAGVCSGVLNGYSMTGWTWASVEDVSALLNHYIGSDELDPTTPYLAIYIECSVVRDFSMDGWRPAHSDEADGIAPAIAWWTGLLRDSNRDRNENQSPYYMGFVLVGPLDFDGYQCYAETAVGLGSGIAAGGGWFWRSL